MPFIGGRSSATRGFFGIGGTPSETSSMSSLEGNQQLTISFTDPTFTGGGDIVNYQYSLSTDGTTFSAFTAVNPADTTSPFTIGGLTNGQQYYVKIRAVNAISAGLESAVLSTNTTPFTISEAPTITSVTSPSSGSVTVAYNAPAFNGGRSITDYVVEYSSNSGSSWTAFSDGTSTATSITVTGLTNGTSYIFRVYAITVAGNGTVSANSSAIVPFTVPNVPTPFTTTAGSSRLFLNFTTPAFNGGSQITGYEYSTNGGSTYVPVSGNLSTSTAVTKEVLSLTAGQSYSTRVRVVNARGFGDAASSSGTPYTVPNAPTSFTATAGSSLLTLAFTTPASNGGSQITGYEYITHSDGARTITGAVFYSYYGTTQYETSTAHGFSVGEEVTVAGVAPSLFNVTRTIAGINSSTSFYFTLGPNGTYSSGGTATGSFTAVNGNLAVSTGVTKTVTGLIPGQSYSTRVRVNNVAGAGATASASGTPYTVPNAPTGFTATAGSSKLTLAFTTPASNGGSQITGYEYSTDAGVTFIAVNGNLSTSTAVTKEVLSLTAGQSYSTRVRVVNAAGESATASDSGTPYTVPNAPATPTSSSGDQFYEVTWVAPTTGGSAITGYDVELLDIAAGTTTLFNAGSTIRTKKFTGLTIGKEYKARVRAKNAAGDSTYSDYATTRTPSFAVTAPTLAGLSGYPSTSDAATWTKRPVRVTFSPTACLNYSKTTIHFGFTGTYNSTPVRESVSSAADQLSDFSTFVNVFGDTQNIGVSTAVECFIRVHNTAGQYVQSTATTFTTSASVTHYTYNEENYFTTNVIQVTNNAMPEVFFNWSGTSSQNITKVGVYANISGASSNTVTQARNPILVLYRATTDAVRTYASLYDFVPLRAMSYDSNNNARYVSELYTPSGVGNPNYDLANNNQKISIRGGGTLAGSVGGLWYAGERINVFCSVKYTQRTTNSI